MNLKKGAHCMVKGVICLGLFLVSFFFIQTGKAATYYFSNNSGDDSRTATQAQSPETPWKSIAKLNSVMSTIKAGDVVLFKRGEEFLGNITITKSGTANLPIVFGAFGTGEKPVITGLVTLAGWVSSGNGIYQSSCSSCLANTNLVLLNNTQQRIGRYPNTGYLTYESTVNNTAIISKNINSATNWTGADLVVRKNRWITDRLKIQSQSGSQINYATGSTDYPQPNHGFFIQNDLRTLDELGEWYFDSGKKLMYIYFGSNLPDNYTVKTAAYATLVSTNSNSYLTFQDLIFTGANDNGFDILNGSNITINNCEISQSGSNAITVTNSASFSLLNSTVSNHLNAGIILDSGCSSATVSNNVFSGIGTLAGMGKNGSGSYQAIMAFGANTNIELNTIKNIGYNGIYFGGNNTIVKNNVISDFCFIKDDGAGIYVGDYFVSTGKKIISNIIFNGIGAPLGTNNTALLDANGIYIDEKSTGIEITGNTAFNNGNAGVYVHNANGLVFSKNTLFNNANKQFYFFEDNLASNLLIRNISLNNNILFAYLINQLTLSYASIGNDLSSFNTGNNNYFVRPLDDRISITTNYVNGTNKVWGAYSLADWKSIQKNDLNSEKSPITFLPYKLINLVGGNKVPGGDFQSNVSNSYIFSEDSNARTSLDNTGVLDAGSLKVTYTAASTSNSEISLGISKIGEVSNQKNYLLKFSALGNSIDRNIGVYLQQSVSPFNLLTPITYVPIQKTRTETEVLFPAPISDSNVNLVFKLKDTDGTIWFDNISLYEANVDITKPQDSILFLYNPTRANTTISLKGNYMDVQRNRYFGNVVLQPFTSLILLRDKLADVNTNPDPPTLTADDTLNTLSASSSLGASEILVSENGGTFVPYTGVINVGDVDRAAGYWQFKIKAATGRNESEIVYSPAFTRAVVVTTPEPPILTADDTLNTLSASSSLGASEILVSENGGAFVPYTGVINVGNVDRPIGYWKFKIKAAAGRNESAVVNSPAFTQSAIIITPDPPTLTADDTLNTLSASSSLGASEILVSENGGAFVPYNGVVINVGNVDRPIGYWKFKIKAAAGRNESAVVNSPAFTQSVIIITPEPPTLTADDTLNTLSASSSLGASEILVSENGGAFVPYTGVIEVGDVDRPIGYWQFKIKAASGRNESAVVNSPAFTKSDFILSIYPNPTNSVLYIIHEIINSVSDVKIISIDGRVWQRKMLEGKSTKSSLDTSYMPAGTYLLHFNINGASYVKKFIKI